MYKKFLVVFVFIIIAFSFISTSVFAVKANGVAGLNFLRLSASIRNYGYVFVPVVAMKSAPSALSPEGINSSPNL